MSVIVAIKEKAFKYYKLAANQGIPEAEYAVGYFYENGMGVEKDIHNAINFYYSAANKNNIDAINALRRMGL